MYFASMTPSQDTTRLIFVRDTGVLGSANFLHLYVDGKKAASLNPAEFVEITISSGEHTFGVKPTDPFNLSPLVVIDQDVKAGRTYRYRLSNSLNGSQISREIEASY